jgi:membrane protease YdiL (CAAX protease family)
MHFFDTFPPLQASLLKVAFPLLAIAVVFLVTKARRLPWRETFGLLAPRAGQTALWMAVYLAWMLITNAIMHWRGPWDFSVWARSALIVDVLRVLAVGILGPIAEELMFRGFLYTRLSRTRIGPTVAIVLLAAFWAAIHIAYPPAVLALLFVDGLLLGFARKQTGSVIVPILMHVMWNLYAVW